MEETTYLADLIKVLKKYLWLIVLLGIIGGVSGRMITNDAPSPTYESSALVLIKQQMKDTNVIINQTDETTRFINSALTLVNTSAILSSVKQELKLKETVYELAEKVRASNENGSYVIKLTASDDNPNQATKVANKIAEVFKRDLGSYLDVESVDVVQLAEVGQETKISPTTRTKANIIMGTMIGLVLGVFLSFVLSYFFKPSKA